ncbi:MAG TPA: glycosyltransferase N-terminal domain-containing protein [Gemmatimonadaceae bacterium]|nr:glycosyltransferase N-terminal domain-containing protein [Gemmatimonadaceae bacterium]
MHPAIRACYGAAGQLARAAAALSPAGRAKWRRALRARRGIRSRYAAWARRRDTTRPLLWVHAPSVGEGLQARIVLELVRARRPDVQLAYTFFSPSAERFARSLDVDFAEYLPFDTPGDARTALDALRPTALVFSKLDVWPILVDEARARHVRLGLISGTLSEVSSRQGRLASHLLEESYASLDRVGAVSTADAERLATLGVRHDHIVVTGDTRYDQALQRAANADRSGALLAPLASNRPTLVAGSTWPSDEAILLPAWLAVRRDVPDARLIIAPHEPTLRHLVPLERWARENGLAWARLDASGIAVADVVIVDRVGVLGDLYALAQAAWVGGGFHGAGLHSVLEPAAFGAPVIFGPRHGNSRDATLLHRARGGDSVATIDEAIEALSLWLGEPESRRAAGEAARALVVSGGGAAERTYALVLSLLDPPAPPAPAGAAGAPPPP